MAKKRKKQTQEPAQAPKTEAAKPSEVRMVIAGTKLKALLNAKKNLATDVGGLRGTFGDMVKKEFGKTPFSKKVFGFLGYLWNLTPERLALELEDLEHGLEASGLNEKAESAPSLGLKQQAEEAPEESGADNVSAFPQPASAAG